MKNRLIILFAVIALVGCTRYREYDPVTGRRTVAFATTGNLGITTDQTSGSDSRAGDGGGIPLLSGGFRNDDRQVARENERATPSLAVGQMTLTGTLDHSTMVDQAGGWIWRGLRTVVTGDVFKTGLRTWGANRAAEAATTTELARIQSGEAIALDSNATAVATEQIRAETAVQLAP